MYELVKTSTKDNLFLYGFLRRGDKSKTAILHIHRYEGDFYSDPFVTIEADSLKQNGYTFLSVETRGSYSEREFEYTDGSFKMIGAHYELLKDAYKDIDAWIEFLIENGYHNIVLQGHSLGAMKAVRYFAEGTHTKYLKKLIIVSPPDIHSLAEIMSEGKYKNYLSIAKDKVERGEGEEIAEKSIFKLRMSYQTILSWLTMDHFGKMFNFSDKDNNFMLLNKIDIPVKVIVGEKDQFINPKSEHNKPVQEAVDILKLNIKDCVEVVIPEADHNYKGKEHEFAQEIIPFLES